ncbi:29819_t:CDS:2 [Gigaspora margarita]|uniref:29819_t:CDS:1 n=1 Tax=Gigaspora margarita TaxID=4874 RepID=A0ABN7W6K8_GIGMA|nr:29819_t:CDS:2 [Gigaspora margarita]
MVDYDTNDYTKYKKIIKIVQQAFGYMVVNNLRNDIIMLYIRTWFLKHDQDNANIIYISSMVPINQQYIKSQALFLEYVCYFEYISNQSDHDPSDNYKLKSKRRKVNILAQTTTTQTFPQDDGAQIIMCHREDIKQRDDPVILVYDIKSTIKPNKFPDSANDPIIIILHDKGMAKNAKLKAEKAELESETAKLNIKNIKLLNEL